MAKKTKVTEVSAEAGPSVHGKWDNHKANLTAIALWEQDTFPALRHDMLGKEFVADSIVLVRTFAVDKTASNVHGQELQEEMAGQYPAELMAWLFGQMGGCYQAMDLPEPKVSLSFMEEPYRTTWTLVVTVWDKARRFWLGQDVKVCLRLLGIGAGDLASRIGKRGELDFRTEAVSNAVANLILAEIFARWSGMEKDFTGWLMEQDDWAFAAE